MFRTLIHPTDFDEPSKEAFRIAQSLAHAIAAKIVVFHIVPPPAVVTDDGRVMLDPQDAAPTDLWADYHALEAENPDVAVQYAVVVADPSKSRRLLEAKIHELGKATLVVMGSHNRRGVRRLLWGSRAEDIVRECPCPVLVVKASPQTSHALGFKPAASATA